jgi:hypothetical protein
LIQSAYGLRVCANLPIPGLSHQLETSEAAPEADLTIHLGSLPHRLDQPRESLNAWYTSNEAEGSEPRLRVWTQEEGLYFRLLYSDGTEFVLNREGTQIWARWPDPMTLEDAAVYLLGPVLGFVLLLRGTNCLHASAVAVDGGAMAVVGPAGAGKSTTAAALVRRGFPVLSEDVVALCDQGGVFHVQPGYPCIRLWPSSVRVLYGDPHALPLLTPNWEKRGLSLAGDDRLFQPAPLPLRAIYLLDERTASESAPRIEAVTPRDSLIALLTNTYLNYLKSKAMRAQEFRVLARVIASVTIRRVVPHEDVDRLPALCDLILNDFRDLARGEDCGVTHSTPDSPEVPFALGSSHV